MATVNKRGNTFQIVVSLGLDVNGKKIRKTTTYKPPENTTPKKAEKLAHEFAIEFERKCKGMTSLNENMRFCDMAEWFIDNYAKNELKEVTAYNYESQIKNHLLPELGNIKLKDFTPAKITAFFKTRKYAPATCRKVYVILQSIFARAVEQGFIKETPCTKAVILPKSKQQKEKKPFLNEYQAKDLLKMVEDSTQFNRIIKVLLYTGMRSGECLALRWQDIDFENKTIHIENTLTDVGGKHWLQPPKTKTSNRYIALSDILAKIFLEQKQYNDEKIAKLGKDYKYPEMVFTTDSGNYVDRSGLNTQFRRFVKDTEFDFITLHSLRHCNATLLINSGIDLKIVSELLGHSDVSTTANVYADVLDSAKAKVADLISLKLQ
ncbi:MAG: site-specific integrase [Ruminococcaceae bacterium]|nr:site-specific integrase [Oscillospiraceae bacterium]